MTQGLFQWLASINNNVQPLWLYGVNKKFSKICMVFYDYLGNLLHLLFIAWGSLIPSYPR